MKILVVYGTTEGQTRKIAERMAARIEDHGPPAELVDSASLPKDLDVDSYDAFIVAGSVHQHRHQASMVHFIAEHLKQLNAKPSAFVSVSLAAVLEEDKREAQAYVDKVLEETGWRPTETMLLAGALLYTHYDFLKRQIMKLIVWKGGGPTDADRDYEFTDWQALSKFVDAFIEKVAA